MDIATGKKNLDRVKANSLQDRITEPFALPRAGCYDNGRIDLLQYK
jgi:hypothetical protein